MNGDSACKEAFCGLYGNAKLKSYLLSEVRAEKLPHALVFDGADGSGKLTVATELASMLGPRYADKIRRGMSPDVTVYAPEDGKRSIGVSLIRDIRAQAYIAPQELSVRVFIIDGAHLLTVEAQNALLKILEEPPSGVYFFLLSENASALLATVRSRAPVLRMQIFEDGELGEYLKENDKRAFSLFSKDQEAFSMLVKASDGTIGGALKRLGSSVDSARKLREKADKLIDLLSVGVRKDIVLFFALSDMQRDELDLLMLELENAVRDMLTVKYGVCTELLYFFTEETAEEKASELARSTLMNIFDCTEKMREYLTVNVNARAFSVRCADMLADAVR